jgi:anti-sigma factor (TIGR02949 family)
VNCEHVERDLHAYLDHELDPIDAATVRQHIVECPECRRRVTELEGLGRLVRSTPYAAAPARLRARVAAQQERRRSATRLASWAAAALVVVAVGAGVTTQWRSTVQGDALAAGVVDAHVRSLMADHLFDVESTDQHTVKPWFLGRIDFAPPVTDLASIGFPLVGGRLDYIDGRQAAALVYRRARHTINVFELPDANGPLAGKVVAIRGFHVVHWRSDGMAFYVVSDLNQAELDDFARALRAP